MKIALVLATTLASGCFKPAVTNGGFACAPDANPACPEGFICIDNRCINGVVPVRVAKTGESWMGQHTDPGLSTAADCPDSSLEPNDGPVPPDGKPIVVMTTLDQVTPKTTKMSICPKGANATTRRHDVDYFRVEVPAGAAAVMAELFYDITYGDLDVAILDAGGSTLASDGTATTDACAVANVKASGTYYVVVVGAGDVDVNRYDVRVRTLSKPTACMTSVADMAVAHD
ncbi:MAG: hypothetical protein JWN44_6224 [Myxococcales bacterium]|nr:hypothetical protein [Myxococcales bacterium]